MMQHLQSQVPGWGIDTPDKRPGVPKESNPPQPVGRPHWTTPERQTTKGSPPVSISRPLTPVYSTANPPRGLSGAIRRAAYRIPEYEKRRWMLLMLADRIDALEHAMRPVPMLLIGVTLFTAGVFAARSVRERGRPAFPRRRKISRRPPTRVALDVSRRRLAVPNPG